MTAEDRMTRALWALILSAIFVVVLLVAALAHDHNHPELNGWLKSLHAKNGAWCCDGKDTDEIDDWQANGSNYKVKYKGVWYEVPDDAVINEPNKTGEPILWMDKGWEKKVRCFMPGSLS